MLPRWDRTPKIGVSTLLSICSNKVYKYRKETESTGQYYAVTKVSIQDLSLRCVSIAQTEQLLTEMINSLALTMVLASASENFSLSHPHSLTQSLSLLLSLSPWLSALYLHSLAYEQ